jgi:hypothetical protein
LGKQPYEILKTEYQVEVNTDVAPRVKPKSARYFINEVVKTSFLDSPRYVADVVSHCAEQYEEYGVALSSPVTSAVLKKLVDEKILERIPSEEKQGRYLYKKPEK